MLIKRGLTFVLLVVAIMATCVAPVFASAKGDYIGVFDATAYELGTATKKSPGDKNYGITASGYSLVGKDWTCRTLAADWNVLKKNKKYYVEFPEGYSHMDGIWTVRDTGVRGQSVDVYFGTNNYKDAMKFGERKVKLYEIAE